MHSKESGRRRFLKEGAALAGLSVGAVRAASGAVPGADAPEVRPKDLHAYGERSRFEDSTIRIGSMGRWTAGSGMADFGFRNR